MYEFVSPHVSSPNAGLIMGKAFNDALNNYLKMQEYARANRQEDLSNKRAEAYNAYMGSLMASNQLKAKAYEDKQQQLNELNKQKNNLLRSVDSLLANRQFDANDMRVLDVVKSEYAKQYNPTLVEEVFTPLYKNAIKIRDSNLIKNRETEMETLRNQNRMSLEQLKAKLKGSSSGKSGSGSSGFISKSTKFNHGAFDDISYLQSAYRQQGKNVPPQTVLKYKNKLVGNQNLIRRSGILKGLPDNVDLTALAGQKFRIGDLEISGKDIFSKYDPSSGFVRSIAEALNNIAYKPENNELWMKNLKQVLGVDRYKEFGEAGKDATSFYEFYSNLSIPQRKKTRLAVNIAVASTIAEAKSMFRKIGVPQKVIEINAKKWEENSMLKMLDRIDKENLNEQDKTSVIYEFLKGMGVDLRSLFNGNSSVIENNLKILGKEIQKTLKKKEGGGE